MSTGLLILRVFVGVIFIYAGWTKLNGGIPMVTNMVDNIGFPMPTFFAWVLALTEFLGGIALVLGVATRVAGGLLAFAMIVAFFGAHSGSFAAGGNTVFILIGATLALAFMGGGAWSLGCYLCKGKKMGMSEGCCQHKH